MDTTSHTPGLSFDKTPLTKEELNTLTKKTEYGDKYGFLKLSIGEAVFLAPPEGTLAAAKFLKRSVGLLKYHYQKGKYAEGSPPKLRKFRVYVAEHGDKCGIIIERTE